MGEACFAPLDPAREAATARPRSPGSKDWHSDCARTFGPRRYKSSTADHERVHDHVNVHVDVHVLVDVIGFSL